MKILPLKLGDLITERMHHNGYLRTATFSGKGNICKREENEENTY